MRFFNFRLPFVINSTRSESPERNRSFDALDYRLRQDAADARIDVSDNLSRQTLDALQQITGQSKPGFLQSWPMIVAPAGIGAIVLSILLLSVQSPTMQIDAKPNPLESGSQTFSLRSIASKNWLPADSIRNASFTNPLMDEARGMYEDANNAAHALLASFPRSLRSSEHQSGPTKTAPPQ